MDDESSMGTEDMVVRVNDFPETRRSACVGHLNRLSYCFQGHRFISFKSSGTRSKRKTFWSRSWKPSKDSVDEVLARRPEHQNCAICLGRVGGGSNGGMCVSL